ncbi:MFS transporter [Paraburkholderia graminis]|uniref:MFS transporter n=1 Tax=Paraburkholderia graminis TaxID=60548 RepID=UPI0038BCCD52
MSTANINVADVVDNARIRSIHLSVFLICAAIALVDGYDTMTLTYASIAIAHEWQIPVAQFAPAFAATLLGMAAGGFVFGHSGDKYGRKTMLLAATASFGFFTIVTPLSSTTTQLIILRLLVGFGVGGLMPNATAIVADYMPTRFQGSAVMIIVGCLAGGGLLGGIAARMLIPDWGWKSLFQLGGLAAFMMISVAWRMLPESVSYLSSQTDNVSRKQAIQILERIDPSLSFAEAMPHIFGRKNQGKSPLATIFGDGRAPVTVLLWIALSLDMIVFYVFSLWLPTLTRESGAPPSVAYSTTALFSLGGLAGSVLLGPLSRRLGEHRTIGLCLCLIVAACWVLAQPYSTPNILYGAATLAGVTAFGTYPAIIALVAGYYPPAVRSTAIGYCSGISRAAATLSPLAVGALFHSGFTARDILLAPICPAMVAFLCIFVIYLLRKKRVIIIY